MSKNVPTRQGSRPPELSFCYMLKTEDVHAAKLCELLQAHGVADEQIDTGLGGDLFRAPADYSSPDGRIEPAEVYAAAIEVIEAEVYRSGGMAREEEEGSFAQAAWKEGFRIPWLLYDGNPYTTSDAKKGEELSRLAEGVSAEGEFEIARAIYRLAFSVEGLGLQVWPVLPSEHNAEYALKFRWGDCTETSWVLYSLYKYAGFEPEFVWVREASDGMPMLHMAVAVWVDGREVIADGLFGFDADHRAVEDLPRLSALATYVNNLAMEERDSARAAGMLERSFGYDPTFPLTHLYLAMDGFPSSTQVGRDDRIKSAAELDPAARDYMHLIFGPRD